MLVRVGILVAASVGAIAVKRASSRKPSTSKDDEDGRSRIAGKEAEEEEEEKEEVKTISGLINAAGVDDDDEMLLPEIESLLTGEIDIPLPPGNSAVAAEMSRLRRLVKELEDREAKLEGELLEYYGLKEQETDIAELQKQLKLKTAEAEMMSAAMKKLQEEAARARKELEAARGKIKELQRQVQLEGSQTKGQLLMLKQQVAGMQGKEAEMAEMERRLKALRELEVEAVELRRKAKELQHEKRELAGRLAAAEGKASALAMMSETELVAAARAEVESLRQANDDLTKQVEALQMGRFGEVEELVYLRWVNACLRYELRNAPAGGKAKELSKSLSPRSRERAKQMLVEYAGSERGGGGDTDVDDALSSMPSSPGGSEDFDTVSVDSSSSRLSSKKPGLMQKLKRWGTRSKDDSSAVSSPARSTRSAKGPLEALMLRNAGDGMAITTFGRREELPEDAAELNAVASSFQVMSKTVLDGVADEKYPTFKDRHKLATEREKVIKQKAEMARAAKLPAPVLPPKLALIKERVPTATGVSSASNDGNGDVSRVDMDSPTVITKMKLAHIEKRPTRVPRPPPARTTPSGAPPQSAPRVPGMPPPPPPPPGGPPPPPPPPGGLQRGGAGSIAGDKVHRAPEIVELYQTLMKRETKRDTAPLGAAVPASAASDARSNMIGEIENRSAFLLAVKADVETQGEFVQSLAGEVRAAKFGNADDLVAFVNWLDEELSFLVDERAVLKHFDWPESKTDALREAAFEYQDLAKLENQVAAFADDPKLPCDAALKKMYSLLEKVEQSVYALLRTRDMAVARYREFGIPVEWLSDSGIVGKIKLASVQLARKYMKRVASELDGAAAAAGEPNREFLLLQGVRFAFRVHQFAGGFDAESMKAFEELRSRMNSAQSSDAPPPP